MDNSTFDEKFAALTLQTIAALEEALGIVIIDEYEKEE